MCLAVVGKVVAVEQDHAVVDVEGNRLSVVTALLPQVEVSNYVLIHTGFAISVIDADEFEERRRVIKEVAESADRLLERG